MRMSHFYCAVFAVASLGAAVNTAVADDAARSWSQTMSYSSPSQQSVDISRAQTEYLLRNRITPGSAVTRCETAGACQSGGSATNVNGYSEVNVQNSSGATIGVTVDADSTQDATSVMGTAEDIGTISFN